MASPLEYSLDNALRPTVKVGAGVQVRFISWHDGNTYPLDGGTITATLDGSGADSETADGIQFTELYTDFKIDVADLPVMPQDRDVVYLIDKDRYFQVLSPGGVRSVEPMDNFLNVHRIHTKEIPNPTGEIVQAAYGNAAGTAYGNDDPEGTSYGSPRR